MGASLSRIDLGSAFSVDQLVSGTYHLCALDRAAGLKCWGVNTNGQLGLGDVVSRGGVASSMGDALPAVEISP